VPIGGGVPRKLSRSCQLPEIVDSFTGEITHSIQDRGVLRPF
jgi:hypothetical protein